MPSRSTVAPVTPQSLRAPHWVFTKIGSSDFPRCACPYLHSSFPFHEYIFTALAQHINCNGLPAPYFEINSALICNLRITQPFRGRRLHTRGSTAQLQSPHPQRTHCTSTALSALPTHTQRSHPQALLVHTLIGAHTQGLILVPYPRVAPCALSTHRLSLHTRTC